MTRNRKWLNLISGVLVLVSLVSLAIPPALRPGIEFTGGAAVTVSYPEQVTAAQITDALRAIGRNEAIVQDAGQDATTGEHEFFIRLGELTLDQRDEAGNVVTPGEESQVRQVLASLGTANIQNFDTVSGIIGGENVRNAIIAVVAASVVILLYVSWAFRRIPNPFRYGTVAVIALVHDVVIVIGLFSVLGKVVGLEVNSMFITGLLLLIGYSVNDTIIIFDRIRENTVKFQGAPLSELVDLSVRETISRSLNTSITLLIVVAALVLFASESIAPLLYVTGAGVIVGAYSSICVAGPLLVSWENGELGKLFGWLPFVGGRRPARA